MAIFYCLLINALLFLAHVIVVHLLTNHSAFSTHVWQLKLTCTAYYLANHSCYSFICSNFFPNEEASRVLRITE